MEIRMITKAEADDIIATREPRGLFYLDTGKSFVGIDNSTGYAWTEEFDTLPKCRAWLLQEQDEGPATRTFAARATSAPRSVSRSPQYQWSGLGTTAATCRTAS